MNSLYIVLPILTLLMFDLGLTLQPQDFMLVAKRPRAVLVGLCGQLLLLPAVAIALATAFGLPPYLYIGVILIACCPGGSSSNIFSMIAKGDIALSVSLTALSSVITLATVPVIMHYATASVGEQTSVELPMGGLLIQNLVTMLVPILAGILVRQKWQRAASSMDSILSKFAFPALMLLAGLFFIQHQDTISQHFTTLGLCVTLLITIAITIAYCGGKAARLNKKERRTIVIEVGMQNAAQAIAVASSPFVFNNGTIAVPAIIYALMMNVLLLAYVGIIRSMKQPIKSF